MLSSHLILCRPLLLLPPISPSIRVFSKLTLSQLFAWGGQTVWSFSFSISPSSEHPGLISSRMDWLDLFAVQGTLKSLLLYYLGWNRSPAQAGCMRQMLRPGALGRPRGIGWRGRWEGGSGWGILVNPWLIHVKVWQKPLQYCKVISLQLIKINEEKKSLLQHHSSKASIFRRSAFFTVQLSHPYMTTGKNHSLD